MGGRAVKRCLPCMLNPFFFVEKTDLQEGFSSRQQSGCNNAWASKEMETDALDIREKFVTRMHPIFISAQRTGERTTLESKLFVNDFPIKIRITWMGCAWSTNVVVGVVVPSLRAISSVSIILPNRMNVVKLAKNTRPSNSEWLHLPKTTKVVNLR